MANISIPITINLPDDWKEQILERVKQDGDWVLVIRCKDCVYFEPNHHWCNFNMADFDCDQFCSYGETKEEVEQREREE